MARTALASADALTIRFARRVASVAVTLHRDTLSDTPPLLVCGGAPLPASAAARDGDLITFRYAVPVAKEPWSEVQLRIDDGDRIAGVVGVGAHDAKRGAPSALATTSGVAALVSLLHAVARETTPSLDETRDA